MIGDALKSMLALLAVGVVVVGGVVAVYDSSLLVPFSRAAVREPRAEPAAVVEYPHVTKAVQELRAARAEVAAAGHDFGGRREAIVRSIDQALVQLEPARFAAK